MKNKKLLWLPVILLFIAGLACSAGSSGTGTDTSPTADPNILFTDDFSSNSSGWDTVRDTTGMTDYDQGGYRIQVLETNTDYWANPNNLSVLTDVSVSVEVKKLAGPDDNDFAILCRYVDQDNFYAFLGSSDGFYGITKVVAGEQQLIGQDSLMSTDAITQGEGVMNTLRADCVGSTLTLYINGTQIASVQDTTFASGIVGLMAGTYDTAGTDILFDNFVVRKP
ncbi:MAG TPA: hypothetical protein PK530_04685 [Anaerolineales bacterium]|nr:hypothetical protein [Anaerolineales bacterium]